MRQTNPIAYVVEATGRSLVAFLVILAFWLSPYRTVDAFADDDTAMRLNGACKGSYPGWLRGVVDGYNNLTSSPVENPTLVLERVPTPEALSKGAERLGFGDGLKDGFSLGVAYGTELARAARTRDDVSQQMAEITARYQAYVREHCSGPGTTTLDWDTTFMNNRGTSTVTSLNEAQIAMHHAAIANQMANAAEDAARDAQEAQARGDQAVFQALRDTARLQARTAEDFAKLAKGQAAAGLEEATQAIIDAQSSAERARKAAEGIAD